VKKQGSRSGLGDEVELSSDTEEDPQRRVIFPVTNPNPTGIEDARLVEFKGRRGKDVSTHVHRPTAGKAIRSELLETELSVLYGLTRRFDWSRNQEQGHAVPTGGCVRPGYAMIRAAARKMRTVPRYFDASVLLGRGVIILRPQFPWEFVQIGNCGSPIEPTRAGCC